MRMIVIRISLLLTLLAMVTLFNDSSIHGDGNNNCDTVPPTIQINNTVTGDTSTIGTTNNHDCGRGHSGNDQVFKFTVTTQTPLPLNKVFLIGKADFDADWAITTHCSSSDSERFTSGDIGCWDFIYSNVPGQKPTAGQGTPTQTPTPVLWGYIQLELSFIDDFGDYYIWVDGHDSDDKGQFSLRLHKDATPTPTNTPQYTYTPTRTPTPTWTCIADTPTPGGPTCPPTDTPGG